MACLLTACAAPTAVATPPAGAPPVGAPSAAGQGALAARATPDLPLIATRQAHIRAALAQDPPVLTLGDGLDEAQRLAQELALRDPRFVQYVRNPQTGQALRNEIMGVYAARDSDITPATQACRQNACYRVEMYSYAFNLTTVAVVDITARAVLAVTQMPDMQPEIPPHLTELAIQIASHATEVADALGVSPADPASGAPSPVMANTKTALNDTRCERSRHLCVAPTFVQGNRALWAIVDLTDHVLVGVRWTDLGNNSGQRITEQRLSEEVITEKYCERETALARGDWALNFILTSSDGMRISDVTFKGDPVLRSAKLVDWHVSYSQREGFGYSDAVGCPTFSSAAVVPYEEPIVEDIVQGEQTIGFRLIQEFRSQGWPQPCNYSYRQRFEFYADGRFRVAVASIGSGCGNDGMYRPVLRIVPAGDDWTFGEWNGTAWETWASERWQLQTDATPYTAEGFQYRFLNRAGRGFGIEPGRGQFGDGGRGDFAYVYVTRWHADRDEGEADMITIGPCCNEDYRQGPEKFIESPPEPIVDAPLVIWYVPQLKNDDRPGNEYCWANAVLENGVYVPKAWPCYAGPMFVPIR